MLDFFLEKGRAFANLPPNLLYSLILLQNLRLEVDPPLNSFHSSFPVNSRKMALSQGEMPPLLSKKHLFTPKSLLQNILLVLATEKL
jgi:hypothetical protein